MAETGGYVRINRMWVVIHLHREEERTAERPRHRTGIVDSQPPAEITAQSDFMAERKITAGEAHCERE